MYDKIKRAGAKACPFDFIKLHLYHTTYFPKFKHYYIIKKRKCVTMITALTKAIL
jgi:hypothetical protein